MIKVDFPEVDLRPIRKIDAALVDKTDDWAILVALQQRKFDGFVTCDENMLSLAKEVVVFSQTQLTLVVCSGAGTDPLVATGQILLQLPGIARKWQARPQLFVLRSPQKAEEDLDARIALLARQEGVAREELMNRHRLTSAQLSTNLRRWYRGADKPARRI